MDMEASHPSCPTAPVPSYNHKPALVHSSFLSLPAVIRKEIYLDAGLLSNEEIDLNGGRRFDYDWSPERPFQVSHDLLLTCRTFYADILPILYSTNAFYIQYRDKGNLERLRVLSPGAIALLTQLTVHLKDTCRDFHPDHGIIRFPLWSENPLENSCQATIIEWQRAASHIVNHIKPSILRLFLICDSADVATAQRVIEPLRTTPTLADCRIRLARSPNNSLQKLAREVSMRAKGYTSTESQTPFRFLDLPQEIRLNVLEFTDLITPLREVEWSSEKKFSLRFSALICGKIKFQWLGRCLPPRYPACQFRKCWHLNRDNAGCFCHRHHAAFSSICQCWAPPTSLFLVCKDLHHEAQMVFYSKNRFVIVPPAEKCYEPVRSTPERLDISIFLRDAVPPQGLSFLKFLDIVFPPFYDDYLRDDDPAYQDWLQTINHLGDLANIPVLTLRVHMADIALHPEDAPEYRTNMTREDAQTIVNSYERAIKPLSKLRERGLNRFFADLTLPWVRTAESIRKRGDESTYIADRREFQAWGERLVMGRDYDSTALRIGAPDEPQWRVSAYEHYLL